MGYLHMWLVVWVVDRSRGVSNSELRDGMLCRMKGGGGVLMKRKLKRMLLWVSDSLY